MFYTPVLLLVFNRLDTTKEVFESIRLQKPNKFYIASDGARINKLDEFTKVEAVRNYILSHIDWDCEIHTLFREGNLGCKLAVSEAIDWFFEHEEMGIILEDDCVPVSGFFKFCQELLVKYRYDTRVMSISGSNHVPFNSSCDYRFSNYTPIWGWATWSRAWKLFDVNIKSFSKFQNEELIDNLFLTSEERVFFTKTFNLVHNGSDSIWDAQWFYTSLVNGVSILPKNNMVKNIGFGADATHTIDKSNKLNNLSTIDNTFDEIVHPAFVIVDKLEDYNIFKYTYYSSFITKVRYKFIQLLQRFFQNES